MSYRECIWIAYPVNVARYVAMLEREYGALPHPTEPGSYVVGDPPLPFHLPQIIEGKLAITSFNWMPLSPSLLTALSQHLELAPPQTQVRWTEEQELVIRGTVERVGRFFSWKER